MRGDRLKLVRDDQGYSQEKLAEMLNIGQLQIWRYENGETEPKGEVLARIAKFLNVSTDYLLGLTDDPHGHLQNDLSEKERRILSALRNNEPIQAIKAIVGDE